MEEETIIPVDNAIHNFRLHLQSHPRTILSAKFGDGKTFFLNEFAKEKDFEVIRISPVNYQVADNNDIFELVKWDLLMQLQAKGILQDTVTKASAFDAFRYSIVNNGWALLENGAEAVSKIPTVTTKIWGEFAKSIFKFAHSLQKIASEYKDFKEKDDNEIDELVKKIEEIPLLECDLLTRLIQDNIKAWKKKRGNKRKRMVLVFDDMDRLDPAHLFRILNIITAHVDYYNKIGHTSTKDLSACKFGVDNIVLVLDYDNLVKIFHHFYGSDTNIEGYIGKFADKGIFRYSITELARNHFYEQLSIMTQIDEDFIAQVIPVKIIMGKSVRELMSSIDDIDSQLINMQVFEEEGINIGIFKLFVVLKRFRESLMDPKFPGIGMVEYVIHIFEDILNKQTIALAEYSGLIMNEWELDPVSSGKQAFNGTYSVFYIKAKDPLGFALLTEDTEYTERVARRTDMEKFVKGVFNHIG